MNFASAQAEIRTPVRSRRDSQESRVEGHFRGLKCEDTMLQTKAEPQFQSPNVREKLSSQLDSQLFAHSCGMGAITGSGVLRSNQIAENQIQFLTPSKPKN